MKNSNSLSEKIVVVGYSHGLFVDEIAPLFEVDPMKTKQLSEVFDDGEVILKPRFNGFDDNAVEVLTADLRLLGYVWAPQAAALKDWLRKNKRSYLRANIRKVDQRANVLMATPETPLHLNLDINSHRRLKMNWGHQLPQVMRSFEEQSLELSMELLHDELLLAKEWTPRLKMRIDNAMAYLHIDLSGNRFMEGVEVYDLMANSEIEEVRKMSSQLLYVYVKRGSRDQITWWVEKWLPCYFESLAKENLLALYEAAEYSQRDIEQLLKCAPYNLFCLYKADKFRFAKKLLYTMLPQELYNRMLTLLAVWELMKGKQQKHEKKTAWRKSLDRRVEDGREVYASNALPKSLAGEHAQKYWKLLKLHHFVDDNCMLLKTTTRQQTCYIAELFAEKEKIKTKWKTFENFWNINNLAQEKHQRLESGLLPSRSDEIDSIFKE